MSMAMMVAMASRQKRDERGRYMDGGNDRRMDGGYEHPEGNYSRMNDGPEMRRRRDSRGRYMDGEDGSRMEYDGRQQGNYGRMEDEPEMRRRRDSRGRYMEAEPSAHYMPWPEPHIPPYLDQPDMREDRNVRPGRERRGYDQYRRSGEYEERPGMGMIDASNYPPVHDQKIVNIRDYRDRRRIGFGENRMEEDDDENDDEEKKDKNHHRGGASFQEDHPMIEQLTEEIATAWVGKLHNVDTERTTGPKWTKETTKPLAIKHGFTTPDQQLEFWAVMNMMYSDYAETAKKHGVSTMDFYADMAKAWIMDPDAVKHKTAAYIACCTE